MSGVGPDVIGNNLTRMAAPKPSRWVSIKRSTRADRGTYRHDLGCHDPQSGANYGAKIMNIIREEEHRNPLQKSA